jgi:hypothetical protein
MNALLHLTDLQNAYPPMKFNYATLATAAPYYEEAPWLFVAASQIHDLEGRPRVYQGIGDLTVTRETAMHARAVLGSLKSFSENLPVPKVGATDGGSLGFIWTLGSKQVEAIVNPDQVTTFVLTTDDEITGDGEFRDDPSPLVQALRELFVA